MKDELKILKLGDLKPSKQNVFDIEEEGIESMIESIRLVGLLTPLTVISSDEEGTYEIISGERRYTALQRLAKENEKYADVPCLILNNLKKELNGLNKEQELIKQMGIMMANVEVRDINNKIHTYRFKIVKIVKELIESDCDFGKKEAMKIYGEYLKVSPRYRRYYTVTEGTPMQPLVEDGTMSIHTASAIANISDPDEKEKVIDFAKNEIEKRKKEKEKNGEEGAIKQFDKEDFKKFQNELHSDDETDETDEDETAITAEIESTDEDMLEDHDLIRSLLQKKADKKGYSDALNEEPVFIRSEATIVRTKLEKLLTNLQNEGKVNNEDRDEILKMKQLLSSFIENYLFN